MYVPGTPGKVQSTLKCGASRGKNLGMTNRTPARLDLASMVALLVPATTSGQILLSPVAVVGTDLGTFSPEAPVEHMIDQSGVQTPFVSGAIAVQPNGDVTVTFTGTLEIASTLEGPFLEAPGNPQGVYTIPKAGLTLQQFFRASGG
jgi:hypothetical protein